MDSELLTTPIPKKIKDWNDINRFLIRSVTSCIKESINTLIDEIHAEKNRDLINEVKNLQNQISKLNSENEQLKTKQKGLEKNLRTLKKEQIESSRPSNFDKDTWKHMVNGHQGSSKEWNSSKCIHCKTIVKHHRSAKRVKIHLQSLKCKSYQNCKKKLSLGTSQKIKKQSGENPA